MPSSRPKEIPVTQTRIHFIIMRELAISSDSLIHGQRVRACCQSGDDEDDGREGAAQETKGRDEDHGTTFPPPSAPVMRMHCQKRA